MKLNTHNAHILCNEKPLFKIWICIESIGFEKKQKAICLMWNIVIFTYIFDFVWTLINHKIEKSIKQYVVTIL